MDLEQYWQKNKSFVIKVALGLLAFLVLNLIVGRTVGKQLRRAESERASQQAKLRRLKSEGHPAAHVQLAQTDHERLLDSIEGFAARVDFAPGADFGAALERPTPATYLATVTRVRDGLLPRASRADVELDPSLGLPDISPTRPEEIVRTLEALDAIERLCQAAIEAGVERVEKIKIRLDPGLFGRRGSGALERTRIDLRLFGKNEAVLRTFLAIERPGAAGTQSLLIESMKGTPERDRPEELRLDLTLVVARLLDTTLLARED